MIKKDITVIGASVLVLGITFKENCPDIRNTKVVDVISSLEEHNLKVKVYDPLANVKEVLNEYGIISTRKLPKEKFDCIILTVSHREFIYLDFDSLKKENSIIYDVKNILSKSIKDKTL